MYRDAAHALDEHDRAVGAILIGEALVDECDRAATRFNTQSSGDTSDHEHWRCVHEVHDTYPEIWRHLDRARRELAHRGANTVAYDELRPHVKRAATDVDAKAIDTHALDEAKRAIAELKLAVVGADWRAIAARTDGLVRAPLLGKEARRTRLAVGVVITAFVLALVAWFLAIVPEHKDKPGEVMRRELAGIQQERKSRIDFLRAEIGDRCLPDAAHDLMRLMVQDGRGADAKGFAATYTARCGDDTVIEHWAHAPRPGH